jgi:cytochrome P450
VTDTFSYPDEAKSFEPTDAYRHLREQCPLHHEADHEPPFYVVSRFADVVGVLKQPDLWGNRHGPGVFYQQAGVLGSADNPDHARHRRVLQSAFLPTAIGRMEEKVAAVADQLFDEIVPLGEGDFIELYAAPFPAIVIGELLGVRAEERDAFQSWSLASVTALTGGDLDAYEEAKGAISDCIEAEVEERARLLDAAAVPAGGDPLGTVLPADVSSLLLLAERDGQLSRAEVRHLGYQLLVAGHETTTSLIGLMLYRLLERPELMAQLRADPELIPVAVEEALRFDSPVSGLFRTNASSCELRGEAIPERSKLQLLFGSANRDPQRFERPDDFRLDREPNELRRHVAFGWGIHFCIGAPLARQETRITFERLFARTDDIEVAGEPRRNDSFVLHGLTHLPLRWTPRREENRRADEPGQ